MEKESLKRASKKIIDTICRLDIDTKDKAELMINLYHFLNIETYENNVKALKKTLNGRLF